LYLHPEYQTPDGPTDYWDANARMHGAFKQEFFNAPSTIKETLKKFTKWVIKPIYDDLVPKTPEHAEYRKKHPASQFTRKVAQILVGNDLDREWLARAQQPDNEQNRRKLHALRVWKVDFDTRLGQLGENAARDPRSRAAVESAMGLVADVLQAEDAGAPAGGIDDLVVRE
jgi:hypothetical protein